MTPPIQYLKVQTGAIETYEQSIQFQKQSIQFQKTQKYHKYKYDMECKYGPSRPRLNL